MARVQAIVSIDHHDKVMAESLAIREAFKAGCVSIEIKTIERTEGAWHVEMTALCESSTKQFVQRDGIPTLEL